MEKQIVFEVIDGGAHVPYHLFFYMITHLALIEGTDDIHYYFPKSCKFADELFALLPKHFIRHYTKDESKYIYTTEHIKEGLFFEDWIYPEYYNFIYDLFSEHVTSEENYPKKIYVSRNTDSPLKRQLFNENEILPIIESYGYKYIQMETLTVLEQIKLFANADTILSPHGSALSFTVFCKPGTKVLEILGKPLTELRHFAHIAWGKGLKFNRFSDCEMFPGDNMVINTEHFTKFLEAVEKI